MPLISMRQLLDHAAEYNYALPAFNINNLEQIHAIMNAAKEIDSPVILQVSTSARKYIGDFFLRNLINAVIKSFPKIPIVLHQDHGQNLKICLSAIQLGFNSIMIDGSLMEDGETISTYEYNVNISKKVVNIAHMIGVSVEAELGVLGSLENMRAGDKEDSHGAIGKLSREKLLTNVKQAKDFVLKTKCDALAIAVGTSHGINKFSKKPNKNTFDIKRIKDINKSIPNVHLVLHGASCIPKNILLEICNFGGKIKKTYGLPIKYIKKSIKFGIRKVNIDTDIRLITTASIRKYFFKNPSKFNPRDYLNEVKNNIKIMCKERFLEFGCEGKASMIKIIS